MNYFELNIQKLSVELLPTFMRKPIIIAFLSILTFPLIGIYLAFIKFRKNVNYELSHNGQVCYLRKVLNDKFDPFYRRIEIKDTKRIGEAIYIYTKNESENTFFIDTEYENNETAYIYTSAEVYEGEGGDFIVCIPQSLYYDQVTSIEQKERFYKIEELINKYKLVTKHYKIIKK